MARRARGPIERQVRRLVIEIAESNPAPGHAVYAAQAQGLARVLDEERAGLAVAAVNRELRELVKAMTSRGEAGDGDPRTSELLARLSAPLGHSAN